MIINHNIAALNTYRQLTINNNHTSKSLEKLSSGMRINRAGDDAAGLAISEKMRAQVRGLEQASRNAQDGISLIQTAEGGLNETHAILQRMRVLANQAANDTNVEIDRGEIQKEINALTSEINRIGNTTEFNTQKLLRGSAQDDQMVSGSGANFNANFQIGANMGQSMTIEMLDMRAEALGIAGKTAGAGAGVSGSPASGKAKFTSGDANVNNGTDNNAQWYALDVSDHSNATAAIQVINDAIEKVSAERSKLGAYQNRLEHTINNLGVSAENLTAAESRIRDVDMAKEMMEFTKQSILGQAAQAMLAQANQLPQGVLQLLR